jgi:hypothetical protein
LAQTYILTAKQRCFFNAQSISADELVATTAVLPLLPEKPRYSKTGAFPKYRDFTLLPV